MHIMISEKNEKEMFPSMRHVQGFLIKPQSHLRWVRDGVLCHAVKPEGGSHFSLLYDNAFTRNHDQFDKFHLLSGTIIIFKCSKV